MQRTLLITFLIVGCDCSITAAQAQSAAGQPAAPRVRIAVAGGLLGQLDGFPELPTHGVDVENGPVTERVVHGGLDGLSAELAASADKATLLLLGGHNLPHNVTALSDDFVPAFLKTLGAVAQVQPTVVGITNEDVNRLLRGINPEQLADWFKKHQVPFVASNLAVRYSKSVMNRITAGEVKLQIAEDASVPWHAVIDIAYPCTMPPEIPPTMHFRQDPKRNDPKPPTPCRGKLQLKNDLWAPGTRYELAGGQLSFVTDSAVTSDAGVLPVFRARSAGGVMVPSVLGLLDPAQPLVVRNDPTWMCLSPAGTQSTCELTILPPADLAGEYIKHALRGEAPAKFVAVLSALSDQATIDLVGELPAVRFVVLDPDSGILGRAQRRGVIKIRAPNAQQVDQAVDDEYRSAALIDGRDPATTAMFVRPEWLGETVVDFAFTQELKANAFLHVNNVSFGTRLVPGSTLEWTSERPGYVSYRLPRFSGSARADEVRVELRAYDGTFDGEPIGDLWFSETQFAAAALHVMRLRADADVAIVAESVGDPDFLAWLAQSYDPSVKQRTIDWMSRLMLQRVLFEGRPYVRVKVKGSELASTIDKILGDRGDWNTPFCVSGISHVACDLEKVDQKNFLVNGRQIVPEHFYAIAMFRDVADAHDLSYADGGDDIHDLLEDMDRVFGRANAGPAPGSVAGLRTVRAITGAAKETGTSLSDRLEDKMRGPQAYVEIRPAKFEFALNNSTLPDDTAAALLSRAVDGGSPKDSRRIDLSTGFDVAPLDTIRHAIRFVGTIEYRDERVENQHTIDKDQLTAGLRYDRKILIKTKTARVFGGAFLEGGLWTHRQSVTPTRVLTNVPDPTDPSVQLSRITVSGPDLHYKLEPRRYRSLTAGFELSDVAAHRLAKLKSVEIRVDAGRTANDIAGATLNGDPLDATVIARSGIGKAVELYYTDVARRQPAASDVLALEYASRSQRRVQTTLRTEHPFTKWNGSDVKINQEFVYRYYDVTQPVAFSFRWNLDQKLSLTLPIPWRMNVVLGSEFDMARLEAVDGRFEVARFTAGIEFPLFAKTSRGGRLAR